MVEEGEQIRAILAEHICRCVGKPIVKIDADDYANAIEFREECECGCHLV